MGNKEVLSKIIDKCFLGIITANNKENLITFLNVHLQQKQNNDYFEYNMFIKDNDQQEEILFAENVMKCLKIMGCIQEYDDGINKENDTVYEGYINKNHSIFIYCGNNATYYAARNKNAGTNFFKKFGVTISLDTSVQDIEDMFFNHLSITYPDILYDEGYKEKMTSYIARVYPRAWIKQPNKFIEDCCRRIKEISYEKSTPNVLNEDCVPFYQESEPSENLSNRLKKNFLLSADLENFITNTAQKNNKLKRNIGSIPSFNLVVLADNIQDSKLFIKDYSDLLYSEEYQLTSSRRYLSCYFNDCSGLDKRLKDETDIGTVYIHHIKDNEMYDENINHLSVCIHKYPSQLVWVIITTSEDLFIKVQESLKETIKDSLDLVKHNDFTLNSYLNSLKNKYAEYSIEATHIDYFIKNNHDLKTKTEIEDAFDAYIQNGLPKIDFDGILEPLCSKAENIENQNNKKDAGIFLVLSKLNKNSVLSDYQIEGKDKKYLGIQTNDAPIEYLIDEVFNKGYNLKKIICVTTSEAKTAYDRFEKFAKQYAKKVWNVETFDIEHIDYAGAAENLYVNFYDQLNVKSDGLNAFFVDYTGGLRDMSFLMVVSIRFLEYKGISCEKVIYSDFFAKPKQLKTLDNAYNLFQMINGMNEFATIGTTRQLDKLFKEENALISAIHKFAFATNIGDVENLNSDIINLSTELNNVKTLKEYNDINSIMISSMSDVISQRIFGTDDNDKLVLDDGKTINYYKLMDWCINNKMYQQAATLYIEKTPVIYWNNGIINDLINLPSSGAMGSSLEVAAFYTELPNWLANDSKMNDFIEKVNSIVPENKTNWNTGGKGRFISQINSKFSPDIANRLKNIVNNNYSDYNRSGTEYETLSDGVTKIDQKNIASFWNHLKDNKKYQYHFIYGTTPEESVSKEKTRMMNTINEIYNNTDLKKNKTNDDKSLSVLLAYYLSIKMIRNKMSHAPECTDESDADVISGLESFFNQYNSDLKIKISLNEMDVDNLIRNAVKYSRNISPFSKADTITV